MAIPSDKLNLYLTHRSALVDYSASILGSRSQAEDVIQEAWLRFCNQPEQRIEQPLGYLYRIVRNLALDMQRRAQLESNVDEAEAQLERLESNTPSPEHYAIQQARLKRLQSALAQLPERTQTAFKLHRLQAMTFQQIAEKLDISTSLAHQLVRDALAYCAAQLHDD